MFEIDVSEACGGPASEQRAQLLVAIAGGLNATNRRVADV